MIEDRAGMNRGITSAWASEIRVVKGIF